MTVQLTPSLSQPRSTKVPSAIKASPGIYFGTNKAKKDAPENPEKVTTGSLGSWFKTGLVNGMKSIVSHLDPRNWGLGWRSMKATYQHIKEKERLPLEYMWMAFDLGIIAVTGGAIIPFHIAWPRFGCSSVFQAFGEGVRKAGGNRYKWLKCKSSSVNDSEYVTVVVKKSDLEAAQKAKNNKASSSDSEASSSEKG